MNFLQTLLAFAVALGTLIVIHELGHYLVARWCGVKVLRFSVGMGQVVWSRRFGADQTEWAVSALPLGGYVKMLDGREQDLRGLPEADLKREFTRQNVWKRIAIVAAGPLANFLLAILLFAGLYMHGVDEPSTLLAPPAAETVAASAGVKGGDQVVAINGQPVRGWSELRWTLIQAAVDKQGARLDIERQGEGRRQLDLPASAFAALSLEGDVPSALGIAVARPPALVGRVMAEGAGARAGLRSGDLIQRVDGVAMADGLAFIEAVRKAPGRSLHIEGRRAGQPFALDLTPDAETDAKGGQPVTVGKIKVEVPMAPDMITVASAPAQALEKAVRKVWETSVLTVKMIGKMITGEASWRNVTGPITIADYAGQTSRIGAVSYLQFIAFISISLGVMNLLPIPVLDGGHLLYYSLEVLTGRPVSERFADLAQRIGVGLLVALMVLAVFNDLARLL
ncbi:RIP metalloprotease RseP [Massilia sp. NR 4-1]|uniref:RIP metalloprotease RseP n=1 Tax=Massilia sp. NR 4-1 TaxID=1678028 RepID=UPI00067D32EB|nr:RIP metalloprotease RseP [Massilia sp. NR 4-1]AKU20725.1 peptidase [Massilia sp. NR 4-1]